MDPPPDALIQETPVAAVETPLQHRRATGAVTAYRARLEDDSPVRLFVLSETANDSATAAFEQLCAEWEAAGEHRGITRVLERGSEPTPWVAVEPLPGDAFAELAPALSAAEQRTVLASIAEILWRVEPPHLTVSPEHIALDREDGLEIRVDWSFDRVALRSGELADDPYIAPELRADPQVGDGRSDVYSLGALAAYAVTGEMPTLDGMENRRQIGVSRDSGTMAWVAQGAMKSEPEERFESCYEFKRAALFGRNWTEPQQPARKEVGDTAEGDWNEAATGQLRETAESQAAADEQYATSAGAYNAPAQYHDSQTMQRTSDSAERERETDSWWLGDKDISRRQALGAAAGISAVGGLAGGTYWYRRGSEPDRDRSTAAGAGETGPELTAEFENRMIELMNTGEVSLDADRVILIGRGFTVPSEGFLEEYIASGTFEPGDSVQIPADPAFELAVNVEGEGTTLEYEGPEADEREPTYSDWYTPDLDFSLSMDGDRIRVEYEGGARVRADHIHLAGVNFEEAPEIRWGERVDIEPDNRLTPGDTSVFEALSDVILRVEWSPPYIDGSTTVAQYDGPDRPGDGDIGTISGARYDERNTGMQSSPGPRDNPAEQWSVSLGGAVNGSLAVDTGRLFATADGSLYALDAADGEVLWHRHIEASEVLAPAVLDETVLVGTTSPRTESSLYAFDVADGTERWEFRTEAAGLWSPTVTSGLIFTGGTGQDEPVYVLNTDGSEQDRIEESDPMLFPAFDNRLLYVRNKAGDIDALNPSGVRWDWEADGVSPPAVGEETLYAIDQSPREPGTVFALDTTEGDERWRFEADTSVSQPPAVTNQTVFVAADDGTVYALESESGEKRWEVLAGDLIETAPIVAGSMVYVVTVDSGLVGIERDGEDGWWEPPTSSQITTEPAVAEGWLFVGDEDGTITAFEGTSVSSE